MATTERTLYDVGIAIRNKEDYDRLMEKHSKEQTNAIFCTGLDFKKLFEGYPEEDQYPCLVQYIVDVDPFGIFLSQQLREIVKDGYHVHIQVEE